MNTADQRLTIYTAVVLLCTVISTVAGPGAGFWSFIQVAVVIELLYWLVLPAKTQSNQSQK